MSAVTDPQANEVLGSGALRGKSEAIPVYSVRL